MNIKYEGRTRLDTGVSVLNAAMDELDSTCVAHNGTVNTELLISAFGACIGMYVTEACQQLDLNPAETCIEVAWVTAHNPVRIGRLHAIITVPAGVPEDKRSVLLNAARNCLIHRSLCGQPEVDLEIR